MGFVCASVIEISCPISLYPFLSHHSYYHFSWRTQLPFLSVGIFNWMRQEFLDSRSVFVQLMVHNCLCFGRAGIEGIADFVVVFVKFRFSFDNC